MSRQATVCMLSVQMEAWGYAEGKRAVSEPANGRMFGSLRMQLHLDHWEFFLQLAGALSDNVGTTQLLQLQEEDSRASQGMTPGIPTLPVAGLSACWEM